MRPAPTPDRRSPECGHQGETQERGQRRTDRRADAALPSTVPVRVSSQEADGELRSRLSQGSAGP
jgi:hypothetical protein